jgi:hypothetical protein
VELLLCQVSKAGAVRWPLSKVVGRLEEKGFRASHDTGPRAGPPGLEKINLTDRGTTHRLAFPLVSIGKGTMT